LIEDMKTQIDTLQRADFLTLNEKREYTGYDRLTDPNMDKIYVASGQTSLDDLNAPIGDNLNNDVNLLNGGQ
jgi:hypothetical protein